MVARSSPKDDRQLFDKMPREAQLVRETVMKVDRAMARLQELQCTVAGASKFRSGVALSPRSTRGYMRTSLRCKHESLRNRESAKRVGENNGVKAKKCGQSFNPAGMDDEPKCSASPGEWRRWSLPAALIQQTLGEIMEASNFAKEVANIVSDSMGNKLTENAKTPQSVFNDSNLLEVTKDKDSQGECNTNLVYRKDHRSSVQGIGNSKDRRHTLDNADHDRIKATQSSLRTPPGKHLPLIGYLQEEGFDGKCFLDKIGSLDRGHIEKKSINGKSQKVVHKFRMVTPESKVKELCFQGASSSLEFRRRAEKQAIRARARAELSQASSRVRSQMSFRACNCANVRGRNAKVLASALVSCCASPAKSINEQTGTPPKPLVKVDQITPARKPWISHSRTTKAIMFPNPTFVPSPLDHRNNSIKFCQRTRCRVSASVERKSLLSVKGFSTPKFTKPSSPFCKKNESISCKLGAIKSSSHPSAQKSKIESPCPSVLFKTPARTSNRMTKQYPVVKTSVATLTARNTPCSSISHKFTPKRAKLSPPVKTKSPMLISSLKKQVCFRRSPNTSYSHLSATTCNSSPLSKQPNDSSVQPLPSLIFKLPSRRNSSPMFNNVQDDLKKKQQIYPLKEDVPSKAVEPKGAEAGTVLPLPPDRQARGMVMPIASIKDDSVEASITKSSFFSMDGMSHQSSVLKNGRSISCPKQRPLKPIDDNINLSSISNQNNNPGASEAEVIMKRKDHQVQGKENKNDSDGEAHDAMMKKSNKLLRRSWSFGHDNVSFVSNGKPNNSTGGLPFLKYVKGLMNIQRTASNVNR